MKQIILTLSTLFLFATHALAQQEIRQTIYFDFASSALGQKNTKRLDSLVALLDQKPEYIVHLRGHTDAIGSEDNNGTLSTNRCYAVRTYLLSKNIPANRITVESLGESIPAFNNSTDAGRAMNRRVEIIVRIPKQEVVTPPPAPTFPGVSGDGSSEKNTATVLKPGPNNVGGFGLEVITNTNQMQAFNLTTQTTGGQPLVSNVMVCITSTPTDTTKREPVKVLVPASFNPYCKFPDVILYDSQIDTNDANQIKWMPLLFPDMKPVVVNGVEYFEWTVAPGTPAGTCKNGDCPKTGNGTAKIKTSSKKYQIVSLSVIYPDANALLRGHATEDANIWEFKYFSNDTLNSPQLKVVVMGRGGKLYTTTVLMRDLKQNRKGVYVLKKKLFVPKA